LLVLLLSLREWYEAARLPRAFRRAGFQVSALTFPGLFIARSRDVQSLTMLPEGGTQADLIGAIRAAIEAAQPTLVVPCDDAAVEWLQAVALTARPCCACSKIRWVTSSITAPCSTGSGWLC
jgi:hypothetical protein